jgi:predicted RNase H-like HicB family nuclease
MRLQQNIHALIRYGERSGYVAECTEIAVVTQGQTLDQVVSNLQEAVSLHLDGENLADFGLVSQPTILISLELQLEYA